MALAIARAVPGQTLTSRRSARLCSWRSAFSVAIFVVPPDADRGRRLGFGPALSALRLLRDAQRPRPTSRPTLRGRRSRSGRAGSLLTFVLYAAAILSKAAAIPLPAVLVVLDVFPLRRIGGAGRWLDAPARRAIGEKLPFFVLGGVFMVAAVIARVYDRNLDPMANTGVGGRISLSCYSAIFYPVKSLWPTHLHAYYMRPRRDSLFGSTFLVSIAATLAITAGLIAVRKRRPGLLAAWAAYLLILAPVSGLVTTGMQLAADRYAYLTMMAFVPALAAGLCDLAPGLARIRFARLGRPILAGSLIFVLGVLTFIQNRSWRDSEALWSRGIEHGAGHVADLHNNLGAVWASKGHYELAVLAFTEALRLKPELAAARNNLGKAMGHLNHRPAPAAPKGPAAG